MISDDFSNSLKREYVLFLTALNGRYLQMRAPGIEISPRALQDLRHDLVNLAETFVNSVSAQVESYADSMAFGGTVELVNDLVGRKLNAEKFIRKSVYENITDVVRVAKAGIGGVGDLLTHDAGSLGALIQKKEGAINFTLKTPTGRRWQATTLFGVVLRDFAYQSFVDAQIDGIKQKGETMFSIVNGDGETMGDYLIDDLEEVRSVYFHLNSHSLVTYVSAE